MPDAQPNLVSTQRRRSERISRPLPIIVRGVDLLGQPFEERTSTLTVNLHGCRYASKYHLPKNTWVTLEIPQGSERRHVRARVAWIQRPHSVREFFQIAAELESPSNVWGIDAPPADWAKTESTEDAGTNSSPSSENEQGKGTAATGGFYREETIMPNMPSQHTESSSAARMASAAEAAGLEESPLLREWSAQLERQAQHAAEAAVAQAEELIRHVVDELDHARAGARENLSAELAALKEDLLGGLRPEIESHFKQVRDLLKELDRTAQALRTEGESAAGAASRLAAARLQAEAAEAARLQAKPEEPAAEKVSFAEAEARWREHLQTEMAVARAQWNELLQSSLDGGIERLVRELSGRSQGLLHDAEQVMFERLSELRKPLGEISSSARAALEGVKESLDQELARARASLTDIEHSAGRLREYSAQLEAASHDTLNELHRRLENILEAQTDELKRRAESLADGVPQRLAPALDALGRQLVERTMADVEAKLAASVQHVSDLLRELAARETQSEESLRLHRERLRQVSESHQREAGASMSTTLASLREEFETARKEALTRWNDELDAAGVRASHAAAESIGRSSEWFQQEARARLQVLVEQALAEGSNSLGEKATEASKVFEAQMESRTAARLEELRGQMDGVAAEISDRARTQLGKAAEAAAASFGEVIRGISGEEMRQFAETGRAALAERASDLETLAGKALAGIEISAGTLVEQFHGKMAAEADSSMACGRSALAAAFAEAMNEHRAERDAHEKSWAETLEQLSGEASGRYQEHLQTAADSWVVSSVRRLSEHGQNATESLLRSADQALRDSFAKIFDGLSEMLRDRAAKASGIGAFIPVASREAAAEPPPPHSDAPSTGAMA